MILLSGLAILPPLLAALVLVAGVLIYNELYTRHIRKNAQFPQLPRSLLWGHLLVFDKFTKRGARDRHPDAIMTEMHQELGSPPVMLLDNWPVVPPIVVVTSHEVAEQVSRPSSTFPYSALKSASLVHNIDLIGSKTLLLKQGQDWKDVRKRFNPGFAPQHLLTLLPVILQNAETYVKILDHFARTRESFSLEQHTTNLTFDVIGAVTMGVDMEAQQINPQAQGDLIRTYKELIKAYANDPINLPWWLNPRAHIKRRRLGEAVSQHLRTIVMRKYESGQLDSNGLASRSILALSLQNVETLTPEIMQETCDQIKTFLFAGHDTTSTWITWTVYELMRTPHALKAVRAELDELFGQENSSDPAVITQKLLSPRGEELIQRMTYTSAVLKESLRLYAPAGTVRTSKPGTGFVVSTKQGDYNLDGNWIYLNHTIIHRDPKIYGETANDFLPERWLQPNDIPPSAWRPFERGPRNCIGQELANIEARVIIAIIVRRFDFTKVGLGELDLSDDGRPVLNEKKQFNVKSKLYASIQIASKPVDGMMVKVQRTSD